MTGTRVAYLTRLGEGMVPRADTVYQDGDLLHLTIARARVGEVERILDRTPPAHD